MVSKENEEAEPVKPKRVEEEEKEFTTPAAMVVTEAIYKFIRRNQKL